MPFVYVIWGLVAVVIVTLVISSLRSCYTTPVEQNVASQAEFIKMQDEFNNWLIYNNGNDLLTEDRTLAYKNHLQQFMDSIQVCSGWMGKVGAVNVYDRIENGITYKYVYFDINDILGTTLNCKRLIKVTESDSNYCYQSLKNIKEYSKVYFDGIILNIESRGLSGLSKNYSFYPLYISADKPNALSENLKTLIKLDYESMNIFKKEFNGELNDGAFSTHVDKTKGSVQHLLSQLTPQEKEYRETLYRVLLSNFKQN